MLHKRIVIALGGNALQKDNGDASASAQQEVADRTARRLVPLVKQGYELVIVHGNGPQVGNIMIHEESVNTPAVPTLPLDTCDAMSQGAIGYWLQQAFIDAFRSEGLPKTAVSLVTETLVDVNDPAFQNPTKPIGPFYANEQEARQVAEQRHFTVREDSGRGWRRVVPSPKPLQIVETAAVNSLLNSGVTVITAGGGGIPVVVKDNQLSGVEAVIDKDFSAAIVADVVQADALVILTAIDSVMINYGQPNQQAVGQIDAATMKGYIEAGYFADAVGSMLPKVEAALQFVSKPGRTSIIASLDKALEAVEHQSGTIIQS